MAQSQVAVASPRAPRVSAPLWIALAHWTRLGIAAAGALLLLVLLVGLDAIAPTGRAAPAPHLALDIFPQKPGGLAQGAAYVPDTVLRMPAHALVTITIRNFDLDPTPLPTDSPYLTVQGTSNGVAYADGKPYTALDSRVIAHTFTVSALHLNVPILGHSSIGKNYVLISFSFRTGGNAVYQWRCFAPCGDGPDGDSGPMSDERYMRGSLFVGS
jgi:hypothetical protein